MVILAAPLELIIAEVSDMNFHALLVVKAMLLIMVIQVAIIQNLGAK
jgi:hypothetical protein